MQVSRFRGRKDMCLHQTNSQGSKDTGQINEAKDHLAVSNGMGHVYKFHKGGVWERNSDTTVQESHNHVYSAH